MSRSLTSAFAISLMVHLIAVAGVELGHKLGWWERSFVSALFKSNVVKEVVKTAQERAEQQRRQLQQQPPEAELVFVDIDPSQAVAEAPRDAKYYSSRNTVAANRTKDIDSLIPKIEGQQDKVPKATDTPRLDPKSATPAPPVEKTVSKAETLKPVFDVSADPPKPSPPKEVEQQKPIEKGETLLAKVVPRQEERSQTPPNNPTPEQPKRQRPKNLAEARAQKGIIEGPRIRQQGGVARLGPVEGLDVKATPFGTYDALFIEAVSSRWHSLLEDRDFVGSESGRVIVEFRLHQDGRITDIKIVSATVNEMLSWFCQRAILDPAPYQKFPPDLRRAMDKDYREIRFSFYYNQ